MCCVSSLFRLHDVSMDADQKNLKQGSATASVCTIQKIAAEIISNNSDDSVSSEADNYFDGLKERISALHIESDINLITLNDFNKRQILDLCVFLAGLALLHKCLETDIKTI